ncbi:MAG: winged helix-turn-helix domain-containing protein [Phycisphaerae bacterium]|nr:winged helix-turn-helix domain-containing protein [Phycisphaerae bacterium]
MKKDQVQIGGTYVAKVSGQLARVRIDAESRFGGWDATNVDTGRRVRIKSAQRLRGPAKEPHPERDYTTLAEFFPVGGLTPARNQTHAPADDPEVCTAVVEDNRPPQDIDERIAAAPPSPPPARFAAANIVPYEERRARAEAAQTEAGDDDGRQYDPSRCATPRCRGTPIMTYLERPLCQACWDRHCDEEQSSEVSENEDDACLPAGQAGRPSEEPQTPDEENAMSKTKTTKKQFTKKQTKAPVKAAKAKAEKKAATPKAKATTENKPKRVSALNAAAQVLAKAGKPMHAQELIAAMAEQGLWTSPGGKTPHATLYAAMMREERDKGGESRFRKVDRGRFEFAGIGR